MNYTEAKNNLYQGKSIRRKIWDDKQFVQNVDGHYMNGRFFWECNNEDANAWDWEVLSTKKEEALIEEKEKEAKAQAKKEEKAAEKLADTPMTPKEIIGAENNAQSVALATQQADRPLPNDVVNPVPRKLSEEEIAQRQNLLSNPDLRETGIHDVRDLTDMDAKKSTTKKETTASKKEEKEDTSKEDKKDEKKK